ncbi:MAG TPA: PH domain-containing protein [Nocardioides sp.]|nr:PH domain-containing protein [Nocardioides sp.]
MPAVSEPVVPALPHTWRPLGVRLAVLFFGGLLVVVCVAGWVAVGPEVRGRVTVYQQATLLLIAAMAGAVAWGLVRCRVTATDLGLEVVNGYRRHAYEWPEVLAVRMPRGAPFVTLDLADGTNAMALAIQSADGDRARVAVGELRALVEQISARSLQRPDPPAD